jgi:putative chitinase
MNIIPNGDPFSLYEMDTELGNYQAGDGAKYRGRGYIWQVGRQEYEKLSVKLGLPNLLDEPEQLSDIDTAIRALLVDRI